MEDTDEIVKIINDENISKIIPRYIQRQAVKKKSQLRVRLK